MTPQRYIVKITAIVEHINGPEPLTSQVAQFAARQLEGRESVVSVDLPDNTFASARLTVAEAETISARRMMKRQSP